MDTAYICLIYDIIHDCRFEIFLFFLFKVVKAFRRNARSMLKPMANYFQEVSLCPSQESCHVRPSSMLQDRNGTVETRKKQIISLVLCLSQ